MIENCIKRQTLLTTIRFGAQCNEAKMALQIFRENQHIFEVTTLIVDNIVWFKAREVAASLGYTNPQKAVRDHVDEEDKKAYEELIDKQNETCPSHKQHPHEIYITESGLYSLILRSHKEEAKIFKRWVTSEVLPSIRQTGGVVHVIQHKVLCTSKPQSSKEERRLLDAGKALTFDEVEHLHELENIVKLAPWLDSRVRATTPEARRKLLYAFRRDCKKARLEQADDEDSLVPLMWNQGGYRIIYTMADEELLLEVLQKLRPKFDAIIRWYSTMKNRAKKQKQETIRKYLKNKSSSSASTDIGDEASADSMES